MSDIITCLDHPQLFAPHFRGGAQSWAAWRTFLKATFALPMTPADLATYRHHTGRTLAPTKPFTELALVCGRRGGKSRLLATTAVYLALRDYSPHLAPGEVATIAIIATDHDQANNIFRYVRALITETPVLAAKVVREYRHSFELDSRVVIEIQTASYRSVRGFTFAAVLLDEIAFFRDERSANPDEEILAAIRPGMSSIPGAMLLVASSPYAKRGALYTMFREHYGKDDSPVLIWKGASLEMNPTLNPAVVERAKAADPARAQSEYMAEFRDDVSGYITRAVVDRCTVPGRIALPPISNIRYRAFVDPSGGSADSMTLAIAHVEKRGDIAVVDAVQEIRPPFSPRRAVEEFAALLKNYRVSTVVGDRYAGEWPREMFREYGINYEISERVRSDIYRDLLPALNSCQVELLDIATLTAQLCSLERRTARGGRDSIDHPPGGHDDLINAAAGALLLVKGEPPPFKITAALLARI